MSKSYCLSFFPYVFILTISILFSFLIPIDLNFSHIGLLSSTEVANLNPELRNALIRLPYYFFSDFLLNFFSELTIERIYFSVLFALLGLSLQRYATNISGKFAANPYFISGLLLFVFFNPFQNIIVGYQFELGLGVSTIGTVGVTVSSAALLFFLARDFVASFLTFILLAFVHPISFLICSALVLFHYIFNFIFYFKNRSEPDGRTLSFILFLMVVVVSVCFYNLIFVDVQALGNALTTDLIRVQNSSGLRGGFWYPWLSFDKLLNLIVLSVVSVGLIIPRYLKVMHVSQYRIELDLAILLVGCQIAILISWCGFLFKFTDIEILALGRIFSYIIPLISVVCYLRLIDLCRKNVLLFLICSSLCLLTVQSSINLAYLFIIVNYSSSSRAPTRLVWGLFCFIVLFRLFGVTQGYDEIGGAEYLSHGIFLIWVIKHVRFFNPKSVAGSIGHLFVLMSFLVAIFYVGKQLDLRISKPVVVKSNFGAKMYDFVGSSKVLDLSGELFYIGVRVLPNNARLGFDLYLSNPTKVMDEIKSLAVHDRDLLRYVDEGSFANTIGLDESIEAMVWNEFSNKRYFSKPSLFRFIAFDSKKIPPNSEVCELRVFGSLTIIDIWSCRPVIPL